MAALCYWGGVEQLEFGFGNFGCYWPVTVEHLLIILAFVVWVRVRFHHLYLCWIGPYSTSSLIDLNPAQLIYRADARHRPLWAHCSASSFGWPRILWGYWLNTSDPLKFLSLLLCLAVLISKYKPLWGYWLCASCSLGRCEGTGLTDVSSSAPLVCWVEAKRPLYGYWLNTSALMGL